MNLSTILENELQLSVDQNVLEMESPRFKSLLRFPPHKYFRAKDKKQTKYSGPGKQVIKNILNYARALEVMPQPSGGSFFLISN